MNNDEIEDDAELWDNRTLGADERFVEVVTDEEAQRIEEAASPESVRGGSK